MHGRMHVVSDRKERLHGLVTRARQLESDLAARREKIGRLSEEKWSSMAILRLDIEEMTGKSGQ
jgi:hypothetical protein